MRQVTIIEGGLIDHELESSIIERVAAVQRSVRYNGLAASSAASFSTTLR